METNPLVSVVLCTYNSSSTLPETIESVLRQSFTDFEFIVWDDGSTDDTSEVVHSFKDPRIRYHHDQNGGIGKASRQACSHARGKYIARIDSDDLCFPHRFQTEVDFLESHPDYVLVSSSVEYIDKNGSVIGRNFLCTDNNVIKKNIQYSSMIVQPMVMFRRDAYIQSGGYQSINIGEDRLLWSRMSKYGKFKNLPTVLGQYRLLSSSLSHSRNPYMKVLYALRTKMIHDEEIQPHDVELFNAIEQLGKESPVVHDNSKVLKRKKTAEEKVYQVLSHIIGKRFSEKTVFAMKDLFCRLKYR